MRHASYESHWTLTPKRSFTLVELLVVIAIIGVLSSIAMFGLFEAQQEARRARTRAQISKINQILMSRWESYRTRSISVSLPAGTNPTVVAGFVLRAKRQLMRMELPDRQTDLADGSQTIIAGVLPLPPPSLWRAYRRRLGFGPPPSATIPPTWIATNQGAECLYAILASIRDEQTSGLDFFSAKEIGDVDNDGQREILDAWGNPIEFLRWAPGFSPSLLQDGTEPDPFDPLKQDPRWSDAITGNEPIALFPLVISAGPDGKFDIVLSHADDRSEQSPSYAPYSNAPAYRNDPYRVSSSSTQLGQATGTGTTDNISNHFLEVK